MAERVVLVTGASGLLGTWLRRTAPDDVEVVPLVHRTAVPDGRCVTADLRDPTAVASVVGDVRPSVILHAAVALDVASIVGATAHVVEAAARVGADVVHVSTDAVFSGDGRPVDERARPEPVSDYGRWKAQAEDLVLGASTRHAVVRLPLVVSLDPEDRAVHRVRTGAVGGHPSRWFHDEVRQPAMAADLADALWRIAALPPHRRSGPWHLPGPERLSRADIARRVAAALGLDPSVVAAEPSPDGVDRPRDLRLRDDRAVAEITWCPARILT